MKTAFVAALCAAIAAGPALAQVTPAPAMDAAGIYQVYRTTDSQLSCEQVIGELNQLNQQIKAQADARANQAAAAQQAVTQAAQPKRGGGFGGLLGAVAQSGLAGQIPGVGGLARNPLAAQAAMNLANAAANNAAQQAAVQQQQAQAAAQAQMASATAAPTTDSNEMQRLRRVQSLMQSKGC